MAAGALGVLITFIFLVGFSDVFFAAQLRKIFSSVRKKYFFSYAAKKAFLIAFVLRVKKDAAKVRIFSRYIQIFTSLLEKKSKCLDFIPSFYALANLFLPFCLQPIEIIVIFAPYLPL
ncbi:MAG: hypothetical protein IJP70_08920 [Bacteroidales bacterium]|nr:hypothetical protein [Bacteroidales bacterium]